MFVCIAHTRFSHVQEDGDLEKATPEKLRLEDKQRVARRVRKEQGVEWQNMWFGQVCTGNFPFTSDEPNKTAVTISMEGSISLMSNVCMVLNVSFLKVIIALHVAFLDTQY